MSDNYVMFDKPYSEGKIKEGLAIHWAFITGACDSCRHLQKCENANDKWRFPEDAPCMIHMRQETQNEN